MKSTFVALVTSVGILSVLGLGCNGGGGGGGNSGGGGGGGGSQSKEQQALALLSQQTGHSYTVVEDSVLTTGYVIGEQSPSGMYVAVNISSFTPGMTLAQLQAATNNKAVYLNLEQLQDPQGNNYYDDTGSGTLFSVGNPCLKDLETLGANLEKSQIDQMGEFLQSSYGLSEDRSQDVARLVQNWSALAQSRSMTNADLKEFSTQALGSDLLTLKKAYDRSRSSGDTADFDALIAKAAETNGVGVEQARKIVTGLLGP